MEEEGREGGREGEVWERGKSSSGLESDSH